MLTWQLRGALPALTLLLAATPGYAEDASTEAVKLDQSLSARVVPVSGSVLDEAKAGYFRVVTTPSHFTQATLCPASKEERDKLKELSTSIWAWALKRKKDWGASAQFVYGGPAPNFDADGFKPDAVMPFFTVHIDGSKECTPGSVNFVTGQSPLFPLNNASATVIHIQFYTWYNDVADRDALGKIVEGGAIALTALGVPAGALQPVQPKVVDTIKTIIDKNKSAKYAVDLNPTNPTMVEEAAYLGLREPASPPTGADPQVNVKLVAVASMFAPLQTDYSNVDLSGMSANDILNFSLSAPTAANPSAITSLQNAITVVTPNFSKMLTDPTDVGASSLCDVLETNLRNDFHLSKVDAAVVLYGITLQRMQSGLTKFARNVGCIAQRENTLALVKIKLPPIVVPPLPGKAATRDQMRDAMDSFTALHFAPADGVPNSLWSMISFPLTIYDSADKFGWDNQQASFTDRAAFKGATDKVFSKIGCWAYFPDLPIAFGPGLGTPGPDSLVRKSAALVLLTTGEVEVLQFRYTTNADGPQIDGLAFVKADAAAKAQMLNSESCKPGAGREWEQAYLRP